MRAVAIAWGRALGAQCSARMLLLSVTPFLLSALLWGALLYVGLQPLLDALQGLVAGDGAGAGAGWFALLGLGMLKALVVPLVAMLLLLPLMILTALLFMGVAAMPAIGCLVGARQFPALALRQGGSLLGSLGVSLGAVLLFLPLWLLTLPLMVFPPLALLTQVLLWGWLTARVMVYDALAASASADEGRAIVRARRWPLLAIGMLSGLAGALPGIVWIGGALISVLLFPVLAMLSLWLYVLIFMFTGLWFQYYCLQALHDMRAGASESALADGRFVAH